jgi:hypothetical protein
LITIHNIGTGNFTFTDNDTNSSASNRFDLGGYSITLLPKQALTLQYDGTSSLWRLIGITRLNFGTTANTMLQGNDASVTNARTPTAHASTHLPGGSDALTTATASSVGATNAAGTAASFARSDHTHAVTDLSIASQATNDGLKFNGSNWVREAVGANSTVLQVSSGGTRQWSTITNAMITAATITDASVASANKDGTAGTPSMRTLGTGATQALAGNDASTTNSRAPNGSATGDLSGSYPAPTVAQGSIAFALNGIISPTQIAANTNDYAPTGLSTASQLRLSTDASRTLTGLTGGAAGRILTLLNVGSFDLVLSDSDAGSSAANRFGFGANITLAAKQAMALQYDGTSSLWRQIGASRVAFGTAANTALQGNDASVTNARTPTAHATSHKSGGSDSIALDTLAATTDITTLNSSTSAHGLLLKLDNVSTDFMNGTGAWSAPAAAGSASGDLAGSYPGPTVKGLTFGSDARGDLPYRGASGYGRLALGSNTFVLTSNGTDAVWAAAAGGAPSGSAGGDLGGSYPNPTVAQSSTAFALNGVISPTQISSNTNDYAPTGLSTASQLRLSDNSGSHNITGLTGGASGRIITILNISSSQNLNLTDEDTASSAANRFELSLGGGGSILTLGPQAGITIQYDGTSSRWREIGCSRLPFGSGSNFNAQGNDARFPPTPSGAGKTIYDNGSAYVAAAAGTTSQVYIGGSAPAFGNVPFAAIPVGSTSTTVVVGNDSRLSDARTPTGAAGGSLTGTYANPATKFTVTMSPGACQNVGATLEPLLSLVAGTNTNYGILAYLDSVSDASQWLIPGAATRYYAGGPITVRVRWYATATTNSAIWKAQMISVAAGTVIDTAYNTAHSTTTTVAGTTLQMNDTDITWTPSGTELVAASTLMVKISRDGATDTLVGTANFVSATITEN